MVTQRATDFKVLTLDRSHIGTGLNVNGHPALVIDFRGSIGAVYRTSFGNGEIIGLTWTSLYSRFEVNGQPRYYTSDGCVYKWDPRYESLDSILKRNSL